MEIWLKLVGAKRIENRSCSRTFSVSQEQNMSNREKQTIAIIGAGEMGAAVGRRLLLSGARVLTSLQGRSRDSADRVRRAGLEVVDNDAALIDNANFVLSIVPPGAAVTVADRYRRFLTASEKNPIFADCNAVAPATARRIGALLEGSVAAVTKVRTSKNATGPAVRTDSLVEHRGFELPVSFGLFPFWKRE
jgi:NAD binding domain of 6-phosphogluconate dehydrogenase